MSVDTGLDNLLSSSIWQAKLKGKIAYLSHAASVDKNVVHGAHGLQRLLGKDLVALFGPQHGFVADVQDNMIETDSFIHPYFKLPVYSLYSETRSPTDEMLEGVDTVIVDLQDVGTRIYTYIYTLTLLMEACGKKGISVIVLDRPNPIGGLTIEGNILDMRYASFVGRHPLPVRHGLTIAEVGLFAQKKLGIDCDYTVIPMNGWKRSMYFEDTQLPWVLPSPNLATVDAAFPFVGTVLFEGTNISEGRGTTRSLEIIGHPKIEPYTFLESLMPILTQAGLEGFVLRPIHFMPTFQKHAGVACGGFQIHVTDRKKYKPWRLAQVLCREFFHTLKGSFEWKQPPYEYVEDMLPIDVINGTDALRLWVEEYGTLEALDIIEEQNQASFLKQRADILLYE